MLYGEEVLSGQINYQEFWSFLGKGKRVRPESKETFPPNPRILDKEFFSRYNSGIMKSDEIRKKYIKFFKASPRNHKEIDPSSLVLEGDATTLFTSAGMQQLVPYLSGKKHRKGKRLVNSQPSLRTQDIDEVGDNRHTTFFEMLGNWSLGDYFKEEQLSWFWEFLTKELNLPKERLWVSVFAGDNQVPKDQESIDIWKKLGVPKEKIHEYGVKENWWSMTGPPSKMSQGDIGGPDSEVFYDFGEDLNFHEHSPWKKQKCHPNCECGRFLEIGNSVFIEYSKSQDGSLKELPQKNVDFGGGLERIAAAVKDNPDVFMTDLLKPIMDEVIKSYFSGIFDESLEYPVGASLFSNNKEAEEFKKRTKESVRIASDHIRASVFIAREGVVPSNKEAGYVLRRLIRRAVLKLEPLRKGIMADSDYTHSFNKVIGAVIDVYKGLYFQNEKQNGQINQTIRDEVANFGKTLRKGLKIVENTDKVTGKVAFDLYQTYGFPLEVTSEIFSEKGQKIDQKEFKQEFEKHKEKSRAASAGMFKGGLADASEEVVKLHTATHLLHWALRKVLGDSVRQEGSNITKERLRFDFSHPQKLTEKEVKKVEDLINQKIEADLPVHKTTEDKDGALKSGALAFFKETYPDKVSVYTIGKDPNKDWVSKELCGGPHVKATSKIGRVRIKKQDKIGSNLIRMYVTAENGGS